MSNNNGNDQIDPGKAAYLAKKAAKEARAADSKKSPNKILRESGLTDAFFQGMAEHGVRVEEAKPLGSNQVKVKFTGVTGNSAHATRKLDGDINNNPELTRQLLADVHKEIAGRNPAIRSFAPKSAELDGQAFG